MNSGTRSIGDASQAAPTTSQTLLPRGTRESRTRPRNSRIRCGSNVTSSFAASRRPNRNSNPMTASHTPAAIASPISSPRIATSRRRRLASLELSAPPRAGPTGITREAAVGLASNPEEVAPVDDAVIRTEGLTKRYGSVLALDSLDLEVARGEVFGFLGPNGAGKTTTIRLLLGLIRPTAGSAAVLGLDPWREAVGLHRRVGYVPGEFVVWPQLTGGEMLELLGNLHGGVDLAYRDELIARFDFDPHKRGRSYSKGNRQKVGLIASLQTRAEVLILDEPTSGLDPLMAAAFQDCAREARDRGQTVFLSSHILSEVEDVCDRVAILRRGRLADVGTLEELRHLSASTVKGYDTAYPTPASRALLAATPLANRGFHALYGIPHAADTTGGFTAWRLGTVMSLLAGVWMLLAATRLLRGEEDDGRWELLVSGATTPARMITATAAALATWLAVAFVALAAALAKAGLPTKGSLVLAGAVALSGAVFAAVGTLASQLVPIRRRASGLAGAFLGLTFLVRVVADGTSGVEWLRGLSPFGWVEEARAFAGDRSATLLLLAGLATAVLAVALAIARRRDLGRGVLFGDDTSRGRDFGLGSSLGFGIRRALGPTAVWTMSLGAFAFVLGLLTKDIVDFAKSSPGAVKIINRLGGSLTVATGYLGFALSFAVLIAALYAGFRVARGSRGGGLRTAGAPTGR